MLMRFDLSALSGMAPISRALFRYTVYDGGDQAEMHEFCRGWTASNVTYDNLPMPTPPWPFSAAVIDTYWGPTVNDLAGNVATHTVDVTPSINRWLTGTPNHGWIFVPYFGNGCGIRTAAWANVAQQPVLEVYFDAPPAPPSLPSPPSPLPSPPTTVVSNVPGLINALGATSFPRIVLAPGRYARALPGSQNDGRQLAHSTTIVGSGSIVGSVASATLLAYAISVALSGSYAYVAAANSDALVVIDVSNPASPVIRGSVVSSSLLDGPRNVAVSGAYAYVAAAESDALVVVDVSNPASPVIRGSVVSSSLLDGPANVAVSGVYAYVAASESDALVVVDVSNPASPVIRGSVVSSSVLDGAISVAVSGVYAYVAAFNSDALVVVEVSNPAYPVIRGSVVSSSLLDGARDVAVSGSFAYVAGQNSRSLVVVDVSNPTSPVIRGSVVSSSLLIDAVGVAVSGVYAYVAAANSNALVVVDVSNPASPAIRGSVVSSSLLDGVRITQSRGARLASGAMIASIMLSPAAPPTAEARSRSRVVLTGSFCRHKWLVRLRAGVSFSIADGCVPGSALATPVAAALASAAALADLATSAAVRRRRRIHLHRGGDLLLDGYVAHRNRGRGAWLYDLRVGLPHADWRYRGTRHRFRQRSSCRQHCTAFLFPNAVLCDSWEF